MTNEQRISLAEKAEAYAEKVMAAKKICPTCKHIIECDTDKQAFYKITGEQCDEWEGNERQTNE